MVEKQNVVIEADERSDGTWFKVLSLAIIWPLRVLTPFAWLCAVVVCLELGDPLAFAKHTAVRTGVNVLLAVEIAFYLWYLKARRRLQRRHTPPALTSQARKELLLRLNSESGNAYQFLDLWFPGASSLSEVGRDELVSWLAWAFFGKTVEEIKAEGPDAADELEALTQEIETSVATRGVKLPKGSTGVTVRRLNLDPVTSKHRPFIYYACTLIMDTAAGIAIRAAGFRRYSLGNIWYYVREAPKQQPQQHVTNFNGNFNRNSSAPLDSSSSAQQSSSAPLPPLIFVHGVGMGLATYIFFVLKLVRGVTSTSDSTSTRQRRIMLIELPHVSLKLGQENVPSVSEFVATAEAAIQRHGFGPSRWIGHSLGTCLVGAFLKAKPHLVHSVVLIDPVCFLLWEVDILENFCYRQPSTAMQDIIHYHMSQELFISHFFHRHFWWYESVLFASDIPTAMSADVFISEIDEISRASAIVPYLAASAAQPERQGRLVVHELKGEGHGGWIVRPPSQATIVAAISG